MLDKKISIKIAAALLIVVLLAFVLSQRWSSSENNLLQGVFVLMLYGAVILSYILRLALILGGVFAIYRVIQEHQSERAQLADGSSCLPSVQHN